MKVIKAILLTLLALGLFGALMIFVCMAMLFA